MIGLDLTPEDVRSLPRWARARITADLLALRALMAAAGELEDAGLVTIALTLDGEVLLRCSRTGALYALAPKVGLLRVSPDGREAMFDASGDQRYDMELP